MKNKYKYKNKRNKKQKRVCINKETKKIFAKF